MEKTNWIKAYIIDVLPCMAVIIYALAIIYNIAYFSEFNIYVISYLSLSEMLISVIEPLLLLVLVVLMMLWICYSLSTILQDLESKIKESVKMNDSTIVKYIVKLRKYKFVGKAIDFLKRKREENQKRREESPKKHRNESLDIFCNTTILLFACYWIFYNEKLEWNFELGGMRSATAGLLLPIMIFFMVEIALLILKSPQFIFSKDGSRPLSDKVLIFLMYFAYAIAIFYTSGMKYGERMRTENNVEFSIKLSDGTVFDNTHYGYISQMNDKIFLFDKKSRDNLILNNQNIVYVQIKKNKTNQSVIKSIEDANKRK